MNRLIIENYGSDNRDNLKLIVSLSRANLAHEKMADALFRQHGLTAAQFSVLEALYHKGPLRMSDIMKAILSSFGTMTVVINNLKRDGMVIKQLCPEDSRAFVVTITEKGTKKMDEVFPCYLDMLCEFVSVLDTDEKHRVRSKLKKLY